MTIRSPNGSLSSLVAELFSLEQAGLDAKQLPPSLHGAWISSRFYVIQGILQSKLAISKLGVFTSASIASRLFGALLSALTLPVKLLRKPPTAILLLHERSIGLDDPYLDVIVHWFSVNRPNADLLYLGDSRCLRLKQVLSQRVCSIECFKAAAKAASFVASLLPIATWHTRFLRDTFGPLINDSIIRIFRRRAYESLVLETAYGAMLFFVRPKILILTVSYTNIPLIRAAKKRGIAVLECQHGLVSDLHVGYGSTAYDTLSKPSYFGLFGPSWPFPKVSERCVVIGAGKKLFPKRVGTSDPLRNTTILVISQKAINTQIAELIPLLRKKFPDNKIVVKLHPSEVFDHPYEGLDATISIDDSCHSLSSHAEYVIGFYSTVVFELAQSGINVNIYPLPGSEMVGRNLPGIFHTDLDVSSLVKAHPRLSRDLPTYFSAASDSALEEILAGDLNL